MAKKPTAVERGIAARQQQQLAIDNARREGQELAEKRRLDGESSAVIRSFVRIIDSLKTADQAAFSHAHLDENDNTIAMSISVKELRRLVWAIRQKTW